ncbi:MAG: RsiV family protein [Lachnospiraceae bacterium]|nr:RsiV family protein [Lachnospiraceae bacterium]
MKDLKADYLEPRMSQAQLERLKQTIDRAKKENRKERQKAGLTRLAACAAAAAIVFVVLPNISAAAAYAMEQLPVIGQLVKIVTFRSYEYEDAKHEAEIEVPELGVEQLMEDKELQASLDSTTGEINEEIRKITTELLEEFMVYVRDEMGYKEVMVKSEVLAATPHYFALKLCCYQAEASGYEENYYYTIDLMSGERLRLKDIFLEGSDYIARISDNIKEQMLQQMEEDEGKTYWLDSEFEDMDFKGITEETSFYLNEKNNVVIGFNEGEVAPMYMGAVEFEIPPEVLSDIRK